MCLKYPCVQDQAAAEHVRIEGFCFFDEGKGIQLQIRQKIGPYHLTLEDSWVVQKAIRRRMLLLVDEEQEQSVPE